MTFIAVVSRITLSLFLFVFACCVGISAQTYTISGHVYRGPSTAGHALTGGTVGLYKMVSVSNYGSVGSPSSSLSLSSTVDGTGAFSITVSSTICSGTSPLYLVATNTSFAAEKLASVVGLCNSTSHTGLVINEATTAAMTTAYAPYIFSWNMVAYTSADSSNLTQAGTDYGNMVTSTGSISTNSRIDAVNAYKLETLSNLIGYCIATSSNCPSLMTLATEPAPLKDTESGTVTNSGGLQGLAFDPVDTFGALMNINNFDIVDFVAAINAYVTTNSVPAVYALSTLPSGASITDYVARASDPVATPTITCSGGTLSLAGGSTPGAALSYTINAGARQTYFVPVSISGTASVTVVAYATEPGFQEAASSPHSCPGSTVGLAISPSAPVVTITGTSTVTVTISPTPTSSTGRVQLQSAYPNVVTLTTSGGTGATASKAIVSGTATYNFTLNGVGADAVGVSQLTASCISGATCNPTMVAAQATGDTSSNTVTTNKPHINGLTSMGATYFNQSDTNGDVAIIEPPADMNQVNNTDTYWGAFSGAVINATWHDLEPSAGNFDFSTIEKRLDILNTLNTNATNAATGHKVVAKIRVWMGNNIPGWLPSLTQEAGGVYQAGVNYDATTAPNAVNFEGLFWSADYESYFKRLVNALGAEYDTRALVGEISATACSSVTDEPFNISTGYLGTGYSSYPSAVTQGYTDAAHEACYEHMPAIYQAAFPKTSLDLTFNPHRQFTAASVIRHRPGFTESAMTGWVESSTRTGRDSVANHAMQFPAQTLDPTAQGYVFNWFPYLQSGYSALVGAQTTSHNAIVCDADSNPGGSGCTFTGSMTGSSNYAYDPVMQFGTQTVYGGYTPAHAYEIELWESYNEPSGTQTHGDGLYVSGDTQRYCSNSTYFGLTTCSSANTAQ